MTIRNAIAAGKTALGIELGSTRIKAVLIGEDHTVLANGSFSWENRLENNLWTYHLDDAVRGLQESFADLVADVKNTYGVELTTVGAIGISGMMHGYLALDKEGKQLAPFLTWRNTNTPAAANELTELFQFNVPLRWSISQLYQAILNGKTMCRRWIISPRWQVTSIICSPVSGSWAWAKHPVCSPLIPSLWTMTRPCCAGQRFLQLGKPAGK